MLIYIVPGKNSSSFACDLMSCGYDHHDLKNCCDLIGGISRPNTLRMSQGTKQVRSWMPARGSTSTLKTSPCNTMGISCSPCLWCKRVWLLHKLSIVELPFNAMRLW